MDLTHLDRLSRALAAPGPRRRVLGLLAGFGGLLGLLAPEETDAARRRKRRKTRHKRRSGSGKKNRKGTHKKPCTAESIAQTCAGRCGSITNTCKKLVDCGTCTCATGCPVCQTCNTTTNACDPVANDAPCDDGDACTQTDRCQNGTCVGSNPVVCTPLDACHVAGTCNPATGVCSTPEKCPAPQDCAGGACCTTAGNTATSGAPCCAGLNTCADGTCKADCCAGVTCGACLTCLGGDCVADAAQDGTCCAGATGQQWCQSGQCVVIPSDARATLLACGGRCFSNYDDSPAFHNVCGTDLKCLDCLDCATAASCDEAVVGFGPEGLGFYCYKGVDGTCENTYVCPSPSTQLCETSGYCYNICFG